MVQGSAFGTYTADRSRVRLYAAWLRSYSDQHPRQLGVSRIACADQKVDHGIGVIELMAFFPELSPPQAPRGVTQQVMTEPSRIRLKSKEKPEDFAS
ncbi:hypothetical protein [Candidatus Entotheonella palauensis]|uniref:hypothetical protein n=1 Tax=Candidatus Entotheonella palauensis TaxID=93172 RepID=UPI000B7DD177|nr:hypothetical protein [Candidatus Entotheonella palauensis]